MEQLPVSEVFGIHIAEHGFQNADIGEQILRHLPHVKQETQVADMVGENIMIHHCGITHAADIINKRLRFFADILTLQKGNRFQRFFGIRRFLVFQQRVGFFYDFPDLRRIHAFL